MPDKLSTNDPNEQANSLSTAQTRSSWLTSPSWPQRAIHVFALSGFAVAQPLFGLLGTEPEFWIARDSSYVDVVALLVAVLVVLPGLAILVEWLISLIDDTASSLFHLLVVAGLGSLVALNVADTLTGGSLRSIYVMAIAGLIGLGVAVLYARLKTARDFVTILAVGPVIFAGVLIMSLPPLNGTDAAALDVGITDENSVVFVVLDEFQLAAVQNEFGDIDSSRYPNLARLAGISTWYPNATTVHDNTLKAVPAILSGSYPSNDKVANAADYPVNLFTALADTHRMVVTEGVTQLCPTTICGSVESSESATDHLMTLGSDSVILYLHTVVPETLRYRLPPIGTRWEGFLRSADDSVVGSESRGDSASIEFELASETGDEERAVGYGSFLDSIDPALGPALYYTHVDLPHAPWSFLDNGKRYPYSDHIPGYSAQGIWGPDEWYVQQAFLRYTENIAFTDMLVGRTLDRLEDQGMMDDTLVIFISDHGENFVVNETRRAITEETLAALGSVPMFVKYPGQTGGQISETNAQTIDLLPTVVGTLGGEIEGVDGRSLVSGAAPDTKRLLTNAGGEFVVDVQEFLALASEHRAQTVAMFPTGEGFSAMFEQSGAMPQLNGVSLSQLTVDNASGSATIAMEDLVKNYDPSGPLDPVAILADVTINGGAFPQLYAIVVNGVVKTVIPAYSVDGDTAAVYGFVAPGSFISGANTVEVLGVAGSGTEVSLLRFR